MIPSADSKPTKKLARCHSPPVQKGFRCGVDAQDESIGKMASWGPLVTVRDRLIRGHIATREATGAAANRGNDPAAIKRSLTRIAQACAHRRRGREVSQIASRRRQGEASTDATRLENVSWSTEQMTGFAAAVITMVGGG